MEKMTSIINENEKIIANILHDIKSPLYSIKFGLQNRLNNQLNRDIFETTMDILEYIEKFLTNYSFKQGKFENKIHQCNIKKIIDKKIENYKYIFIDKNIKIDLILDDEKYQIDTIEIFISSIIGNIISNMAFHASKNQKAVIELYKKANQICIDFKNLYSATNENFSLGLEFCAKLAKLIKTEIKFKKTKEMVCVSLKIPNLKTNLRKQIIGI